VRDFEKMVEPVVSQFKAKIFILWEDLKKNKENNNDG
jgi:hypothetical protein